MTDAAVSADTTTDTTPPPGGVPASSADNTPPPADAKSNGNGAAPVGDITDSDVEGKEGAATWPDDWRQRLAGTDPEALKRLNRFKGPDGVFKSWRSLEQRLSAGELKSSLPKEASEEQVAEWRKENGLPEKPEGYALTRVIGHEWTDADKPMLEGFLSEAHAANFSQAQVDNALTWYAKQQDQVSTQRFEADVQAKQSLEDTLRTEWGPEFRGNIGLLKRYMDSDVPEGGGAALLSARLEDGSRLIDQPWFAKWVVGLARDTHGDASFIGGDSGVAAGVTRKKDIENIMHTDPNRYWKDKGMQSEYLALTQREERSRR
jgi:hypothetical protein